MSKSIASVAPKERINIKYVPADNGQQSEIELPLKLLITGDFKGHPEDTALEERHAVRIDKDTFDDVLAKAEVGLDMTVASKLGQASQAELEIRLQFRSINDFGPDAIAQQIPELRKLLELRESLVALKGPMGNMPAFRKQMMLLLGDEHTRARLASELSAALDSQQT